MHIPGISNIQQYLCDKGKWQYGGWFHKCLENMLIDGEHRVLNTMGSKQKGHRFADIFKLIFLNEIFCILIQISLKFVPACPSDNEPPLVQIRAWRRIGDKSLSEPMVAWWRHQMETFSALLAFCVGNSPATGEFPSQRPVTRGFDVFSDLRLNKRLCKHSGRRRF